MEEEIKFQSAGGLKLVDTVFVPDDLKCREKRHGFIALPGAG